MLRGKAVYNFWGKVDYNFETSKMTIKRLFYWFINGFAARFQA